MLWLKAFHIIFVVTWFAGLFYLPRLFIYHLTALDDISRARFEVMERRLFGIMTVGGVLAALFGISLVISAPAYLELPWLHVKLTLVVVLIGYHLWCFRLMQQLQANTLRHSERWLRLFNEVPALLLFAIVVLAVVKPSI